MSNRRQRRRRRRAAQDNADIAHNDNTNNGNEKTPKPVMLSKPSITNEYTDTISSFTFEYVTGLLLDALLRDFAMCKSTPQEVTSLICSFYGKMKPNRVDSKIPKIMQMAEEIDKSNVVGPCPCCRVPRVPGLGDYGTREIRRFRLNASFNEWVPFMRKLFCNRIIMDKKYGIHSILFYDHPNITLKQQFEYLQYILVQRYNTVRKIDLSEMEITDDHIVYFCNMVEQIVKYLETKQEKKKKKKHNLVLHLQDLNLSLNPQISDKHVALLLRTIKKHLPMMTDLYLSSSNVTSQSIAVIMKYNIVNMKVHLTDCTGVTLKALMKHPRGDYEEDIVEKYVYCNKLIYFASDKEPMQGDSNDRRGGGRVGKNKAKKWKRRK